MKKIISILIAFVMLVSLVSLSLTSCNKSEEETVKNPTNNSNDNNPPSEEGDIFEERAAISDGLGEYNFEGKSLRFVCHNGGGEIFVNDDERNKGNLIKDAKFYRNQTVEDRFNFKMELAYTGDIYQVGDWVSKNVLSGADEFDVLVNHALSTGGLVSKKLFLNWYSIPNIDFSKPWWAASNTTDLTYDGKCILAVSDLNYSSVTCTFCMVFSKDLAAAYDLNDIYQLAFDGKWTFDRFYDMIKDVYADSDGSSTRTDGDFYGMAQNDYNDINQWMWAFDNPIISKNEDGIPTITLRNDKTATIVSKLYEYCFNTDGVYYEPTLLTAKKLFLDKRAIFTLITLDQLTFEEFRDFDDEYGVLPIPKYDENQTQYRTLSYGEHTVSAVPKTCKDLEFVGTCIEALSAESYKTVVPTFYEIALKTRYLRDNESKKSIDLIIDGRLLDFGYIYDNWKGYAYMLTNMFNEGNSAFESYYASRISSAKSHFNMIINAFNKLD